MSTAGTACVFVMEGEMSKIAAPQVIEGIAGQIDAELARRGIASGRRVTIAIEPEQPEDWLAAARRFARAKVEAEGCSDSDIDRIIDEEREAVQTPCG